MVAGVCKLGVRKLRQEVGEFEASLGCILRSCLNKKNNKILSHQHHWIREIKVL